uniref:Uncharacterized protein n=1 Tax=Cacopsylla melanoneura TaxID=428564 RepID=A0A8D8W6S4_9HEMI
MSVSLAIIKFTFTIYVYVHNIMYVCIRTIIVHCIIFQDIFQDVIFINIKSFINSIFKVFINTIITIFFLRPFFVFFYDFTPPKIMIIIIVFPRFFIIFLLLIKLIRYNQ